MDLASKISGADPTPIRVYNECVNQSNASNNEFVNQSNASNKPTSNCVTTCFVIYNNSSIKTDLF